MKKIISKKYKRVTKNKKRLEKELQIKIKNRGSEISISGEPKKEYIAEKVILALDFGFPFEKALEIKTRNLSFETLNLKKYSKTKKFKRIRGRIIGREGRALKTLSDLTEGYFELKDNEIGIICEPEEKQRIIGGIVMLIGGAKHSSVYYFLEKTPRENIEDLGIKESFKKQKESK
jgi:ribosomal RNA assembly protein